MPWQGGVEWWLEVWWDAPRHLTWAYGPEHGQMNRFMTYSLDFHGVYWELRHPAHKTPWTVLICEQNPPLVLIRSKHAQFKTHLAISATDISTTRCYPSAQTKVRHSPLCKEKTKGNACIYNVRVFFDSVSRLLLFVFVCLLFFFSSVMYFEICIAHFLNSQMHY